MWLSLLLFAQNKGIVPCRERVGSCLPCCFCCDSSFGESWRRKRVSVFYSLSFCLAEASISSPRDACAPAAPRGRQDPNTTASRAAACCSARTTLRALAAATGPAAFLTFYSAVTELLASSPIFLLVLLGFQTPERKGRIDGLASENLSTYQNRFRLLMRKFLVHLIDI